MSRLPSCSRDRAEGWAIIGSGPGVDPGSPAERGFAHLQKCVCSPGWASLIDGGQRKVGRWALRGRKAFGGLGRGMGKS